MADDLSRVWVLIVGLGLTSLLLRGMFVLPGHRLRLPPTVERVLRYAPAAAIMAIIVPALTGGGGLSAVTLSPRLVAGVAGFAIAWVTRSVLLTVVGGMLVLAAASWLLS